MSFVDSALVVRYMMWLLVTSFCDILRRIFYLNSTVDSVSVQYSEEWLFFVK